MEIATQFDPAFNWNDVEWTVRSGGFSNNTRTR
jgi:hypothetical protein